MHLSTAEAFLSCFLLIAALPKIFFRRDGAFNLRWFATGAPYFLGAVSIILGYCQSLPFWVDADSSLYKVMEALSIPFAMGSFGLTCLAMGTNRIPLALWHQDNDAPKSIVTYGAYSRIRHPFYTSFILALLGTVLAAPHWLSVVSLIYGFMLKTITAQREEKRLCASEFGSEYAEYMKRTGRFFPRLRG